MGVAMTPGPPPPFNHKDNQSPFLSEVHQTICSPLIDPDRLTSSLLAPAGIGLSVHSIYLLECAPKRLRGMVGVTVATFASFGKFFAQLLGIR